MDTTVNRPIAATGVADGVPATSWQTPKLVCFGQVQDLTAGGSAQNYSEAFECRNQQIFFRC